MGIGTIAVVVALLSGVSWVAAASGTPRLFEVIAAAGVVLGLGVAFGALDRRPTASRGGAGPVVPPQLAADVRASLAALDQVEHRQLDLGDPWPTVIVGPTGTAVVSVAAAVAGEPLERLLSVVAEVRGLVSSSDGQAAVPVQGLLVVPDVSKAGRLADGLRAITAEQLIDAVVRGPLLPMSVVAALFARLSGTLAPDLREVR